MLHSRRIACFALLILCFGCASTAPHAQFTPNAVESIRVGMSPTEIEGLFGRPDSVWTGEFGTKTSRSWSALVWRYTLDPDTLYRYNERRHVNTFVFWNEVQPPKLNNWTIEETKLAGVKH